MTGKRAPRAEITDEMVDGAKAPAWRPTCIPPEPHDA
jgi:hypothetical protein